MTNLLMTTWDGGGTTPPLLSVARVLVARGHRLRVLADPVLRADVEATGAELRTEFRTPQDEDRYAVLDYWNYEDKAGRHFGWRVERNPVAFM